MALERTDLNNRQVAELIGCTGETVRKIRCGLIYWDVSPELPRFKEGKRLKPAAEQRSCGWCEHWAHGRCGFGIPDPLTEGLGFAADCDLYQVCDKALTGHAAAA
jgi:hypothetical protein